MVMSILYTVLRGVFAYITLLLLARVMGRKIISQMTFFDFAAGISIGSVAGNLAVGEYSTPLHTFITLVVFSLMLILSDYFHIKNFKMRKFIDCEPVVVIKNGTFVNENMRKTKLTVNELMTLLRENGVFNAADVEFAVFETDGQLSVLRKAEKQMVTLDDLNIKGSYTGLTKDVIIDGNIIFDNLKSAKVDEQWLINKLNSQEIYDISDVFYAGLDTNYNLFVSKRMYQNFKQSQDGIE